MNGVEIVLAVVLGLIVNEATDISPWLGRTLVTWSARIRYGETTRAEIRAEELTAVINDRPGKLFKLTTGLAFFSAALAVRARRLVSRDRHPLADLPDQLLSGRRRFVLEDEPSTLVARYLFPTERYRGEWRRHWMHPAKNVAFIAAYAILGVILTNQRIKPQYVGRIVTAIVVAAVLLAAFQGLRWYFGRFIITNKRLMSTEGVLTRRVATIPLLRVTDVRYTQSPIGRVLSYGTFTLESASRRNALRKITDLPNPNELYLRLVEEMYEPAAVEARLGHAAANPEEDETAEPADPETVQREVIHQIQVLTTHLAVLSATIDKMTPTPAGTAGTAPPDGTETTPGPPAPKAAEPAAPALATDDVRVAPTTAPEPERHLLRPLPQLGQPPR